MTPYARLDLHAKLTQMIGNQLCGADLLAREFGVLVDIAAPFEGMPLIGASLFRLDSDPLHEFGKVRKVPLDTRRHRFRRAAYGNEAGAGEALRDRGSASAFLSSALSLATIGAGVFAGASRAK